MTTPTITDDMLAEIERDFSGGHEITVVDEGCKLISAMASELRTLRAQAASIKAESETWEMRACAEATSCIELRAELESCRLDAERYQFLRQAETNPAFLARLEDAKRWFTEYMICEERMDSAIDAAMQEQAK
jgi:hypothetical protein